jgi:hypothetical protein
MWPSPQRDVHPSRSRAIPPPPGRRLDELIPAARPREPIFAGAGGVVGSEDTVDGIPGRWRAGEQRFDRKSDYWSPCVRDFVQTQPEPARAVLGEALSLYSTSCTGGPARRVEFQTPAGRLAPAQSYIGLVGALEQSRGELALRAAFHGQAVRADRITLIADGARWSSPRIDFEDDDGWEIATLPLTRELARVVRRAADARDVLLRFESERSYEDVAVSEDMKQDLRVMLDALDAINRP